MCCSGHTIERVRLTRCHHDIFHLYLGGQTLHLTLHELTMIGQAINRWCHAHPRVWSEMDKATWEELDNGVDLD